LRASTFFCAFSIVLPSIPSEIGISSSIPTWVIISCILSPPKSLMSSSSKDTKNLDSPGSPCLPDLPLSWLSILLDSCLSEPITYKPPTSFTPSPSAISVPLPAIFVAMVTEPFCPASAITIASLSCCFAFSTLCLIPSLESMLESISDFSTDVVPTSIGCPFA